MRSAALVATLFGFLSLLAALQTWHERLHPDLDIALGIADALVTLGLAYLLSRRSLAAAWMLLGLAGVGALYNTVWLGFPLFSILPQAIGGVFYGRAISALRYLRGQTRA